MTGTTPVSSYRLLNNSSETNTQYLTDNDGNSVVNRRISANFAPWGSTTMTVNVDAGHLFNGVTVTETSAWTSSTITAPVANSRIDRIVVNQTTGIPQIVTGTAAASPTPPTIPTGTCPIAQILLSTATTTLGNSTLTDERDLAMLGQAQGRLIPYSSDTGAANAYAISPSPAISSYAVGDLFTVRIQNAQTSTAPTLAVNGLSAITITVPSSLALAPSMMSTAADAMLMYNSAGTMTLMNPQLVVASSGFPGLAPALTLSSNQYVNGFGNYSSVPTVSSASVGLVPILPGANGQTLLSSGAWVSPYSAYCQFSVSAGVPTINKNLNIASVVRNAQGEYTVTVNSSTPISSYPIINAFAFSGSSATGTAAEGATISTTVIKLFFFDYNTGVLNDPASVSMNVLNV